MNQRIKNFLFKKRIKILKNKRGFTLMEVLVAVSIIGIISAIAFPQFQDYRKQAGKTAGDTSINNIERAFQNCVVLKKVSDCQSLSGLGVACKGCKANVNGDNFCVHIERTAGGDKFRACVDFDGGALVGRAYGGSLFEDIKICHEKLDGCHATDNDNETPGSAAVPQKGAVECTGVGDCSNSLSCVTTPAVVDGDGNVTTAAVTKNGTVSCSTVNKEHGVCQATGECKRS